MQNNKYIASYSIKKSSKPDMQKTRSAGRAFLLIFNPKALKIVTKSKQLLETTKPEKGD